MASENSPPQPDGGPSPILDQLRSDRANLAGRLRAPHWLAAGFGLVAAAVIALPALLPEAWHSLVLAAALLASFALLSGYHHSTGIKLSRVGARAWTVYALAVGVSSLLLSVSYGLAASGLHRWIAASAVVGFVLVAWLVRQFVAAAQNHLRHDS